MKKKITSFASYLFSIVLLIVFCSYYNCYGIFKIGLNDVCLKENTVYAQKSGHNLKYKDASFCNSGVKITDLKDEVKGNEVISDEFVKSFIDISIMLSSFDYDENNKGNTLISPLSIIMALALLGNGADGESLGQIERLFGDSLKISDINNELKKFDDLMKSNCHGKTSVNNSNSIWITNDNEFNLSDEFNSNINKYFDAENFVVNFNNKKTLEKINKWVSDKTNGMIKNGIDDNVINSQTILALINSICFESEWANPFKKSKIKDESFYGNNGESKVTMLYGVEDEYIEGSGEIGFVKYYEGGNYAFVSLLPKDENIKIGEYLKTLDSNKILDLINDRKNGFVKIGLPKFSFDFSISLKKVFEKLGVSDIFAPNLANLSKIGNFDNGKNNLYVSSFNHKTHIDVDILGTKASGVTSIIMSKTSLRPMIPDKKIILNRPFAYMIIDTKTNLPIFIGTCENI